MIFQGAFQQLAILEMSFVDGDGLPEQGAVLDGFQGRILEGFAFDSVRALVALV